VKPQPRRS